jgi:hypothetical protein
VVVAVSVTEDGDRFEAIVVSGVAKDLGALADVCEGEARLVQIREGKETV